MLSYENFLSLLYGISLPLQLIYRLCFVVEELVFRVVSARTVQKLKHTTHIRLSYLINHQTDLDNVAFRVAIQNSGSLMST